MDIKDEMKDSARSALKMDHIVFDRISFVRKGFQDSASKDISFKARAKIEQDAENQYSVTLFVSAEKDLEYVAEVQITGYCTIDDNHPQKETLLNENAVAILFPYIRAELSLITAQPETDPIVLPTMNISAMFKRKSDK